MPMSSYFCSLSLEGSSFPDIASLKMAVQGVAKLLKELDVHKATGPDNISSSHLLKEFNLELAPVLTLIFQASIATSVSPTIGLENIKCSSYLSIRRRS